MCWVSHLACNKAVQINGLLIHGILPVTVALRIAVYYSCINSYAFLEDKREVQVTMKEQPVFWRCFLPFPFSHHSRFRKKINIFNFLCSWLLVLPFCSGKARREQSFIGLFLFLKMQHQQHWSCYCLAWFGSVLLEHGWCFLVHTLMMSFLQSLSDSIPLSLFISLWISKKSEMQWWTKLYFVVQIYNYVFCMEKKEDFVHKSLLNVCADSFSPL